MRPPTCLSLKQLQCWRHASRNTQQCQSHHKPWSRIWHGNLCRASLQEGALLSCTWQLTLCVYMLRHSLTLHRNHHAKKPNFNVNGAFVEYTANFLCNCAAQQIQQIPEQCELQAVHRHRHLPAGACHLRCVGLTAMRHSQAAGGTRMPLVLCASHSSVVHRQTAEIIIRQSRSTGTEPNRGHALPCCCPLAAAVVELCRRFRDQLLTPQRARQGILPLLAALQRLSPAKTHLTPLHADILQL